MACRLLLLSAMLRFARAGLGLGIFFSIAGPLTCSRLSIDQGGARVSTAATRPAALGERSVAAPRGWIGARFATASVQADAHSPSAARVLRVVSGLAGDRAGLQVGDLVIAVGLHRVVGRDALSDALAQYPPGTKVDLGISREGHLMNLAVRLDSTDAVVMGIATSSRGPF